MHMIVHSTGSTSFLLSWTRSLSLLARARVASPRNMAGWPDTPRISRVSGVGPALNTRYKHGTSRVDRTIAFARRNKNIFRDPTEPSSDANELRSLYRSFNDDDEDDTSAYGTPVLTEDEGDSLDSKGKKKTPRRPSPKVTSADFIKSSVSLDQCPAPLYPEFAVIGRSNVGKSSLINMLTGRNALAMVSKTPGKTKCINHFFINKSWYLVDLPGIGYARTSRENIEMWNKFTREFFLYRETLVNVFLLVDASIEPMEIDIESAKWFGESEIPFTVVYTKLDKKKKKGGASEENIAAFEERLLEWFEELPRRVRTSSKEGLGKGALLGLISEMRGEWMTDR
jgi:GTP-binding protein